MRTFILKARQGTTEWQQVRQQVGKKGHIEIIAHSVINAFFVSNGFREEVEVFIVLESSSNFPRTIKLSKGLSLAGFHEEAVLDLIETTLKQSHDLQKDETRVLSPGLQINGFGFEKLVSHLLETRDIYLLDPKGEDIRTMEFAANPIFILSDHMALPKNLVKSLKRRGLKTISLGKKMLFASQCITLLHYELDGKSL